MDLAQNYQTHGQSQFQGHEDTKLTNLSLASSLLCLPSPPSPPSPPTQSCSDRLPARRASVTSVAWASSSMTPSRSPGSSARSPPSAAPTSSRPSAAASSLYETHSHAPRPFVLSHLFELAVWFDFLQSYRQP